MDFNILFGTIIMIVASHIFIHEVVLAVRAIINILSSSGNITFDTAMKLLTGAVTWDEAFFDEQFKAIAAANNRNAQSSKLVRFIGAGFFLLGFLIFNKLIAFSSFNAV